uniref:Tumor necrosis factor alpha-induced protein 8-like protein 2 n=1 Tax=Myotis lucifugus TaxID=59463 RepID=G1Q0Q5_MYOLU
LKSFRTQSLALHAEKLPSKMAGRSVAHLFMYETSSEVLEVLDELYRVSREYKRKSRPHAQRVIKDLIKVAVKVAVLPRSRCLGPSELALLPALTALSFGEVDFTFGAVVLAGLLSCQDILLVLVQHHLTPKPHSHSRCGFHHLSGPGLLTALYGPDFLQHLGKIGDGLRKLLGEGQL